MLETLKSPWAIILGMNLLMIVIRTFLDLPAAVLLLAPIFLGDAPQIGLDSIQLGVMMVVNLAIGLYTPPVGTTLFVSVAIERVQMGQVVRHLVAFYIVALIVLDLVSFVPGEVVPKLRKATSPPECEVRGGYAAACLPKAINTLPHGNCELTEIQIWRNNASSDFSCSINNRGDIRGGRGRDIFGGRKKLHRILGRGRKP